jgi:hypothetical protein
MGARDSPRVLEAPRPAGWFISILNDSWWATVQTTPKKKEKKISREDG